MSPFDIYAHEAVTMFDLVTEAYVSNQRPLITKRNGVWRIAISGTENYHDVYQDLRFNRVKTKMFAGSVHAGFFDVFSKQVLPHITNLADEARRETPRAVHFAGHSMGGPVASLAALWFMANQTAVSRHNVVEYTFGSPRPGDRAFRLAHDHAVPNAWRIVHDFDLITRIPKWGYDHVGQRLRLDAHGKEIGAVRGGLAKVAEWFSWRPHDFRDHSLPSYRAALTGYLMHMALRQTLVISL